MVLEKTYTNGLSSTFAEEQSTDWLEIAHQLHLRLLQDMDPAALEKAASPPWG